MHFEDFRARHSILHYRSFSFERGKDFIAVRFVFELEPGIVFQPQLVVEASSELSDSELAPFAFHVGLAELATYWKCACPREIRISAGYLSPEQCNWWHDLLLHGMGEFYFKNQIDFTRPDFLHITVSADAARHNQQNTLPSDGGYILAAGGKDSSLTLELLRDQPKLRAMILNPSRAALGSASISGYNFPLALRRTIDPTLLRLNEQGYLNGHTPFSSYLAFAATYAAAVTGRAELIVSNELSANESNVVFHDLPINHQYSKSFRFERMFRSYVSRFLTPSISYFSMLRPLYDLQVAGLFAHYCEEHFFNFRSCNVGSKRDTWCGTCPKCAFTYLALAAFLPFSKLESIFGRDISTEPDIEVELRGLLGIVPIKPFECVGTRDESRAALLRAIERAKSENEAIPTVLTRLSSEIPALPSTSLSLGEIAAEHFVPEQYLAILTRALQDTFSDDD